MHVENYYFMKAQLNLLNANSMDIIKVLVLTITCNIREDINNLKNTHIIKLIIINYTSFENELDIIYNIKC